MNLTSRRASSKAWEESLSSGHGHETSRTGRGAPHLHLRL